MFKRHLIPEETALDPRALVGKNVSDPHGHRVAEKAVARVSDFGACDTCRSLGHQLRGAPGLAECSAIVILKFFTIILKQGSCWCLV